MSALVIIGGMGAIAALAASRDDGAPPGPTGAPVMMTAPLSGTSVKMTAVQTAGVKGTVAGATKGRLSPLVAASQGTRDPSIDALVTSGFAAAEAEARKYFESLSADAKARGAAFLNEEYNLDPPLTGLETWNEIAKQVGAQGGAAGCTALGAGAASPICAMAGAFMGDKFYDFVKKHWSDVEDWSERQWAAFKDKTANAATEVYDQTVGRVLSWIS